MSDIEFRLLRAQFFDNQSTKNLLPRFVRDNIDGNGIWAYLKDVHTGDGAYSARRRHINAEFQPLLDFLTSVNAPSDAGVTDSLAQYDASAISDVWQKALHRRKFDPAGAITSARTLLEEVCKHILEDAGNAPTENWDLPKLYSEASKIMNLSPSQHTEDVFKRILGGSQSIVENLGTLRNKISDAHGGGRQKVKPAERHAALAVNLAGTMAMFLIETWQVHRAKIAVDAAKGEGKPEPETHKGVRLSSRYDLAREITDMKAIVDGLTPDMARRIKAIWCDSKACALYSVTVREGLWVSDIQWAIADAGRAQGG